MSTARAARSHLCSSHTICPSVARALRSCGPVLAPQAAAQPCTYTAPILRQRAHGSCACLGGPSPSPPRLEVMRTLCARRRATQRPMSTWSSASLAWPRCPPPSPSRQHASPSMSQPRCLPHIRSSRLRAKSTAARHASSASRARTSRPQEASRVASREAPPDSTSATLTTSRRPARHPHFRPPSRLRPHPRCHRRRHRRPHRPARLHVHP